MLDEIAFNNMKSQNKGSKVDFPALREKIETMNYFRNVSTPGGRRYEEARKIFAEIWPVLKSLDVRYTIEDLTFRSERGVGA
jgi:hypothetical protein